MTPLEIILIILLICSLITIGFLSLTIKNKTTNTPENTDNVLINLNGVKNRILGLLSHDLKEISYSHHLLSEKINFLIEKENADEVVKLGNHIQNQGLKFIAIVEHLNSWIKINKDLKIDDYQSIVLDENIRTELSHYIAHSSNRKELNNLNIEDFSTIAKNIRCLKL